jgi:hypothetical protein
MLTHFFGGFHPPLCAPSGALAPGRPHWHSGPNHPLIGPITLPQSLPCLRSRGAGGFDILPE